MTRDEKYLLKKSSIETCRDFLHDYGTVIGIPLGELMSSSRKRELVFYRTIVFKILKKHFNMTLAQIGRLTNRDHATVMYGISKYDELKDLYPEYRHAYSVAISVAYQYNIDNTSKMSDLMAVLMNNNAKLRRKLIEVEHEKANLIEAARAAQKRLGEMKSRFNKLNYSINQGNPI